MITEFGGARQVQSLSLVVSARRDHSIWWCLLGAITECGGVRQV